MTFQEYLQTEYFKKLDGNLRESKRMKKWIWLLLGLFISAMVVGYLLFDEEKNDAGIWDWQNILSLSLVGVGFVFMIVLCVFGARYTKRDDNGNVRPAYLIALWLYAWEAFSDGWRVENGVVTFYLDCRSVRPKEYEMWLEREEEAVQVLPDALKETGDVMDALLIVQMGLYAWVEKTSPVLTSVRYRVKENGVLADQKWSFLWREGRPKYSMRRVRYSYRRARRIAMKKGIIEQ